MRHPNLATLAFIATLLAILPGCKTPRSGDHQLFIRLDPVPSPPVEVEHKWAYAKWWLWGWAPGVETIGRYQSDQNGTIVVLHIDRRSDWLVINDPRYEPVDIAGNQDLPMSARSFNEQTGVQDTIGVACDGVMTLRLLPRK